MNDLKFCPECGAELIPNDRFCGDCGFDTRSLAAPVSGSASTPGSRADINPQLESYQPPGPQMPSSSNLQQTTAANNTSLGNRSGTSNALVIMIGLLVALLAVGGGIYWWLSQDGNSGKPASSSAVQNNHSPTAPQQQQGSTGTADIDLSRASAYLSQPGLKYTFSVNYPDGTAAIVDRISARVVPNEVVRVSEVETGIDMGEAYGYTFHYVERPDGTYYILDESPNEIFPVLKNNLTVGQTWNYQDEFGSIVWTVVDMGVSLELGFATFENCLLVQEENQAADYKSVTYYAPGRGIILVRDVSGSMDYYRLTNMEQIELEQANDTVIKWSPNYANIKDDRTQN